MVPQTMAEKIISRHMGTDVSAGDVVLTDVDMAMATDGSAPMAIDLFKRIEGATVKFPEKIVFVEDHYVPCPNDSVAAFHRKMEKFASTNGCMLFRTGEGICHRLLPEKGLVSPGDFVAGADSHTTTCGALNSFATGIGSSDFAGILYTGKMWVRVPRSISVIISGRLPEGVFAKDAALYFVGTLGADGGRYASLEFGGSGLSSLSMEARFTLCNMGVETGAKAAIMPFDGVTEAWVLDNPGEKVLIRCKPASADEGALYDKILGIDLSCLSPMLAVPHKVDNVHLVTDYEGSAIDMAVIGTCTNGSFEDLETAAEILRTNALAEGVKLLVVPPSRDILLKAMEKGLISLFVEKGATIVPPGCGPCCGALNGVPADGEKVISTANRNFKGRMGNVNSEVFLASPATVAASAVSGGIADPRRFLK